MMRTGSTLVEVLMVAWLFGLVLAAVAGFARSQNRVVAHISDQVRAQEVARTAAVVLGSEVRHLAGSDFTMPSPHALPLRAVRGGGPLCLSSGSELVVRYRGARRPEPAKDSVLLLGEGDAAGQAAALKGVTSDTACGGSLRLALDRTPAADVGWALVFERGEYHLSAGALRYRRGAGGRQPLTEALIRDGRFELRSPHALGVELMLYEDSLPRLSPGIVHLRVPLANGAAP